MSASAKRRRAAFVAPTTPAASGNGLAMRAGLFLDALALDHDVTLLVAPVAGPPPGEWPPFVLDRSISRHCLRRERSPDGDSTDRGREDAARRDLAAIERRLLPLLSQRIARTSVDEALAVLHGDPALDVVLGLGLHLAPFVTAFGDALVPRPRRLLDLNEDDVKTRERLAALHAVQCRPALADVERIEADKYRLVEARWLGAFERTFVSSETDRRTIAARTGHDRIHVVPNAVALAPHRSHAATTDDGSFQLLFVGTLNYPPNVDAATVLCREILPALRARVDRDVRVDLVGARPTAEVEDLQSIDGVTLHANVPDVTPYYARAHVAVVPIRAGGGTRLKILEAFAHGVPVVSTSIGAEGLDVTPEHDLLVADDVPGIAEACHGVLTNPALRERLRARGRVVVEEHYETSAIVPRIRALLDEPIDPVEHVAHVAR